MNWLGELAMLAFVLVLIVGIIVWFAAAYHWAKFKLAEPQKTLFAMWPRSDSSATARLRYGIATKWMFRFLACVGIAFAIGLVGQLLGGWNVH
jgi:hypothetical protein